MKGNGDDHDKAGLVKLTMGSNGANVDKAISLQNFDNTPIGFSLHAKTGSMMSVLARRFLRPRMASSQAHVNQA